MKHHFLIVVLATLFITPLTLQAQHWQVSQQDPLTSRVTAKTHAATANYWAMPDAYGTPPIIKLARQGEVDTLRSLAKQPLAANVLLATDAQGNNLFHVAKNADTIQAIAFLLRHVYGAAATQKITQLANAVNKQGERPLNAQINAAHADTFRPLYAYTVLKQKNDNARSRLARLYGTNEEIFVQNKKIYCADIKQASAANGKTLLEAAQAQVPYHPHMAPLAGRISRILPCLTEN